MDNTEPKTLVYDYDKYCLYSEIIASIMTMMYVSLQHGQISVDGMVETFLAGIVLGWVASVLLKITGTQKVIFRIGFSNEKA